MNQVGRRKANSTSKKWLWEILSAPVADHMCICQRVQQLRVLILVLTLFMGGTSDLALAAPLNQCAAAFSRLNGQGSTKGFDETKPIYLPGSQLPLSYSFDAELSMQSISRLIFRIDQGKSLKHIFSETVDFFERQMSKNQKAASALVREIARGNSDSAKEAEMRLSIERQTDLYLETVQFARKHSFDLNGKHSNYEKLQLIFQNKGLSAIEEIVQRVLTLDRDRHTELIQIFSEATQQARERFGAKGTPALTRIQNFKYSSIVEELIQRFDRELRPIYQQLNIRAKVERDGFDPEAKHLSYDVVLADFKTMMHEWTRRFSKAETQFHVGIPEKAVTLEQVLAIAKNLEMMIVLRFGRDLDTPSTQPMTWVSSYLATTDPANLGKVGRGLVKAEAHAFYSEAKRESSYDIEIRQYHNVDQVWRLIDSVVVMAKDASRLRADVGEGKFNHKAFNTEVGNLTAALFRAGQLLKNGNAEESLLSKQLLSAAKRLHQFDILNSKRAEGTEPSVREKEIEIELRQDISRLLRESDVEEILFRNQHWF